MKRKIASKPHLTPVAEARSFLNQHCINLTYLAAEGDFEIVMDVQDTVKTAVKILLQNHKRVPLLVGSSAMVHQKVAEGLALLLLRKSIPPTLKGKTVFLVDTDRLAKHKAEDENYPEFAANLVRYARLLNVVLYIDNLCAFCALNFNEELEVEELFKSSLADGSLLCLAASPCEKAGCLLGMQTFQNPMRSFLTPLESPIPNAEECLRFLQANAMFLKMHAGECVEFTDAAFSAAAELGARHFTPLPEAAFSLLKTAAQDAVVDALPDSDLLGDQPPEQKIIVTRESVEQTAARFQGVTYESTAQSHAEKLVHLEDDLRKKVIGQDEVIKALADALRTAEAGFKEPNRPVGVFLFAGSTGTGKTELAKSLAECLYGDASKIVRVDMSEYLESHTVSRLFGAPPGYVGHDQGGQLTNMVMKNPRCVVLLDEIEKAHPWVLNSFLQVFDDGRLTDGQGYTVSFQEAIILMTTNLGAGALGEMQVNPFGFCPNSTSVFSPYGLSQYQKKVMDAVSKGLRPEFINRITKILVFKPLDKATIRQILEKTIQRKLALVKDKQISLNLSEEVSTALEKDGFNPLYGAREVERAVEHGLIQPLAAFLLCNKQYEKITIQVSLDKGELHFQIS
jgi:ATP-dependent Clp protease ATP-binding subunit ClpC